MNRQYSSRLFLCIIYRFVFYNFQISSLFTLYFAGGTTPDSTTSDSFSFETLQHSSGTDESTNIKSSVASSDLSPDIETVYQKALQFIELTNELKLAPETLRRQYEHLESLKDQLSTSIDELKKQSDTVLNKEK